jgi:predicted dehydrogenase
MEQVRVGVIGVGRMGQRHCRVFSNMRKAQLVGVYDINATIGQQVAKQYEVPYYSEINDLLDNADAICLATPTKYHYELAVHCLNSKKHLMIEKPIAESEEEAWKLANLAEQSGLIVQVGHVERFNPAYLELKNILEDLHPLVINFNRLSPYQGSNKDVDVILDLMIHDTNLVVDLLGRDPQYLEAYGLTTYSGKIDHGMAHIGFEKGPIVSLTASRITENKVRRIEATCREAYVDCDLLNKSISIYRFTIGEYQNSNGKRGVKYRQESIVERINVPTFEPLFLELQHFADAVIDNRTPSVNAMDGYKAMKLALDISNIINERLVNMDRRLKPRELAVAVNS